MLCSVKLLVILHLLRIGELVEVMMKILEEDKELSPEEEEDGYVVSFSVSNIPLSAFLWGY